MEDIQVFILIYIIYRYFCDNAESASLSIIIEIQNNFKSILLSKLYFPNIKFKLHESITHYSHTAASVNFSGIKILKV